MANRLTSIAAELAAILRSITVANGFPFDFGTVNQPDLAVAQIEPGDTRPTADITYCDELPRSDTQAALGYDECTFAVTITACNDSFAPTDAAQPTPVHAIDAVYDEILGAIKKKIRTNQGYLPVSGSATMLYAGFTKNIERSGDVRSPDSVTVRIKVHYQSTDTADGFGPVPIQEAF